MSLEPGLCLYWKLGRQDYWEAWQLQRGLARARQEGSLGDVLLLLEHPPTYTLGRGGKEANIPLKEEELARLGARLYRVDRGGDVTYHGPGQLVGYPILDLRRWGSDAHLYLRRLEEVLLGALAALGVAGARLEGYTGVWVGEEKIAAIGVRIARWVTSHGFALNVNTDLAYFRHIVPCGLANRGVTSLQELLGAPVDMGLVAEGVLRHFGQQFGLTMVAGDPAALSEVLLRPAPLG